jgi:hypothetical protein
MMFDFLRLYQQYGSFSSTHFRIEFARLGVVFMMQQHTVADECIGPSIGMVLDIQSGPVKRITIVSADFENDTRTLERNIHEHAVWRKGKARRLSREGPGAILQNSEEATLSIPTVHTTIVAAVLAEVQDTVGRAVAKVKDTGNLIGLRVENSRKGAGTSDCGQTKGRTSEKSERKWSSSCTMIV